MASLNKRLEKLEKKSGDGPDLRIYMCEEDGETCLVDGKAYTREELAQLFPDDTLLFVVYE